ncbi:MAG: hypothetical protein RI895_1632, partial [Actinomycetota bacterium]
VLRLGQAYGAKSAEEVAAHLGV